MCHGTVGVLANLFNCIYSDRITHLLGNGTEELLVYRCNVEALSSCYVVMPLSSDSGLVCNGNPFTVWPPVHWVNFDVEVEVGEGLDVFFWAFLLTFICLQVRSASRMTFREALNEATGLRATRSSTLVRP